MSKQRQISFAGPAPERLGGTVERVTFHSEESGFCVLRVKVRGHRELVTVVGTLAAVAPGELLESEGRWVNDRTHGRQFKASSLRVVPPSTLEGIRKYLGSGIVKGIGPHFAKTLVDAFEESVFDVIEQAPERLLELPGIGPKRQQHVVRAWKEQRAVRDIMVFLQSHGVGTARAVRIYKTYGDAAVDLIQENPYRLSTEIHGIGFKTADAIAQRIGIPPHSLIRARAGVRHVLQEKAGDGHCALARGALVEEANRLLEIPAATVEEAVDAEVAAGNLVAEPIGGEPALFLTPLFRAEAGVSAHLERLMAGPTPWGPIDSGRALAWVREKTGTELSSSQREAVTAALGGKATVITGGPGVGKTTVVNSILRILGAKRVRVVLTAPTGRAAKRLSESTGLEAKTIHRTLEFDPKRMGFKRGPGWPLEADLVVVDEVSMVDVVLMNQLLRAIPSHAALLLVGDADQLPSVGPGVVLEDIIASGRLPAVRLTEIFRQAAASRIIVNAHRINRGQLPEAEEGDPGASDFYFIAAAAPEAIHERLLEVVTTRIPKRFGLHPIEEVQVLTPMNRGGLGASALNVDLQRELNPNAEPRLTRFGWTYAPGDKVIQTVNNYDLDVFNGDIGRVTAIDLDPELMTVDFDGRAVRYEMGELDEISLAYATTIHKSQGSEYPAVVIPLSTQHYALLERNLLYTAVTRGRQLVVIIGEPRALAIAVKTARSRTRTTNLAARLRG